MTKYELLRKKHNKHNCGTQYSTYRSSYNNLPPHPPDNHHSSDIGGSERYKNSRKTNLFLLNKAVS